MNKEELFQILNGKDEMAAYETVKIMGRESMETDRYCQWIPDFARLLTDKSSYKRVRGFALICKQARWDDRGLIQSVWERMVPLLHDEKPTVVRQCLGALKEVAAFRPEMHGCIATAVQQIEPGKYKDSMSPLILRDMDALLKLLKCSGE